MPYQYPNDFTSSLPGFGGNVAKTRAQHRETLAQSPFCVTILLHGQVANAFHPQWGQERLRDNLISLGVPGELIFACSWLGENNTASHTIYPVRTHIDAVRQWIDSISDYFGGNIKLNVVGHSLGGMMAKAWLYGHQSDGSWDNEGHGKVDILNTLVLLASNNYGLGPGMPTEFATDSPFEENSHIWNGIFEDSARGSDNVDEMVAPPGTDWKKTTRYDDSNCRYIAVIAANDYCDMQQRDTSRIEGADKNIRRDLGIGVIGHEEVIKRDTIVQEFVDHLKKHVIAKITISPESGTYASNLEILVEVVPNHLAVSYEARRVVTEIEMGYIKETELAKFTGMVNHGEAFNLPDDGMWKIVFTAAEADNVYKAYGVNVILPVATIETPNQPEFVNRLDVVATATKGTLYYSLDGTLFAEGNMVTIRDDRVVAFIAIDEQGIASEIVSRHYTKKIQPTKIEFGTATEHYVAGRLNVTEYIAMGEKYGYVQRFYLYLIGDKWTDDYHEVPEDVYVPELHIDTDSGRYTDGIRVQITAVDDQDPTPLIYYTTNGELPTENDRCRPSALAITFDTNGTHRLNCFAKDRSGNRSDIESRDYTIDMTTPLPDVSADVPPGELTEAVVVTLAVQYGAVVYFTMDGSTPDTGSNFFTSTKSFEISQNGNHSIRCLCVSDAGQVYRTFDYTLDDHRYPQTGITPSLGGIYVGSVSIKLTPNEAVEWSKYTLDGTVPDDDTGLLYNGPFTLDHTARLKWRSKDKQGNIEPVHTAAFTIMKEFNEIVFDNNRQKDGYVKAYPDGEPCVGTFDSLVVGTTADGAINRAILHFDTASIPDNAIIEKAYLKIRFRANVNNPWADGRQMVMDVQKGFFGSSSSIQANDWGAEATAAAVAAIDQFGVEPKNSSDFSPQGIAAINFTGVTQIRLRFSPDPSENNRYALINRGAGVKLIIEYTL